MKRIKSFYFGEAPRAYWVGFLTRVHNQNQTIRPAVNWCGISGKRELAAAAWLALFFLLLPVSASTVYAQNQRRPLAPDISGSVGLFRTHSSEIMPRDTFTLGLATEIFVADGFLLSDSKTKRLTSTFHVSWVPYWEPVDWEDYGVGLEVTVAPMWSGVTVTGANPTFVDPDKIRLVQITGMNAGLKLSFTNPNEDHKRDFSGYLGLFMQVPSEVNNIGLKFGQTSYEVSVGGTWDVAAPSDIDPTQRNLPLRFHLNLGYQWNGYKGTRTFLPATTPGGNPDPRADPTNTILRFALHRPDSNLIPIRLGGEYVIRRYLTFFLEWGMDGITGGPPGFNFGQSPQRLGLGVRFYPTKQFVASVGSEFALVQNPNPQIAIDPDWNLILQVAYLGLPEPPPPPIPLIEPQERQIIAVTKGKIAGYVRDKDTFEPIGRAMVRYPDRGLTDQITDKDTGAFTSYEFEAGPVEVECHYQGYPIPGRVTVEVIAGQTTLTECLLQRPREAPPEMAVFQGTVRDEDGNLVAGTVRMDGRSERTETEAGIGAFRFTFSPGQYSATASAAGYFDETFKFGLVADQILVHDFVLKKKPVIERKRMVEVKDDRLEIGQMILFVTGKAAILEQSFPILSEVAEMLRENPKLRVEIGGHTDTRGSDAVNRKLSQARADSVRNWLIERGGIEQGRLTAVGYGESVPLVVPDDTELKRARNRRVEFRILPD